VTSHVELALDARAELGEAPFWDADARVLVWVDIPAGIVHRTDPATGEDQTIHVGRSVGSAVPTTDGRLAVATDDGFSFVDASTAATEPIASIAAVPGVVMNDGKTDPSGRYWAGTKDTEASRPLGSLYRLDADRTVTEMVGGVTLSNGLGWSPDARTMYFIDSTTYGIDAFDTDPASGAISSRRRLVDLPREWGLPDGMTVDADGFLWVAFWTGSAVRRLDPDGNLSATVELPVGLITSCAFGGPDLTDLYVTSARVGLSEERLRSEPTSGGLFRVRSSVSGLPTARFPATTLDGRKFP
jgi:sugar lactone lactonase YvrE